MKQHKLIKDMSKEERAAYQREWYAKRSKDAPQALTLTIVNCPDDLKQAILAVMAQEAK